MYGKFVHVDHARRVPGKQFIVRHGHMLQQTHKSLVVPR